METPSSPLYDSADPRIYFAAERTLLAWVRTGLALMGLGFVVARFGLFLREMAAAGSPAPQHSSGWSVYVGTGLVAVGVIVNLAATFKHIRTIGQLRRGEPVWPKPISLVTTVGALLTLLGLAIVLYLARSF